MKKIAVLIVALVALFAFGIANAGQVNVEKKEGLGSCIFRNGDHPIALI